MSTKFNLLIDVDLCKRVTSLNAKPEVVWSRRGRHLEIVYDVITQPRVARFGRNLGTWFRIARKLLRSGQNRKGKKNSNRQIDIVICVVFFVFLMQFRLRRAAAFVSSPIHLKQFNNRETNGLYYTGQPSYSFWLKMHYLVGVDGHYSSCGSCIGLTRYKNSSSNGI